MLCCCVLWYHVITYNTTLVGYRIRPICFFVRQESTCRSTVVLSEHYPQQQQNCKAMTSKNDASQQTPFMATNMNLVDGKDLALAYSRLTGELYQEAANSLDPKALVTLICTPDEIRRFYVSMNLPMPAEFSPCAGSAAFPARPAMPAIPPSAADPVGVPEVPATAAIAAQPAHDGRFPDFAPRPTRPAFVASASAAQNSHNASLYEDTLVLWQDTYDRLAVIKAKFLSFLPAAFVQALSQPSLTGKPFATWTIREIAAQAHLQYALRTTDDIATVLAAVATPPTIAQMSTEATFLAYLQQIQSTLSLLPANMPMSYAMWAVQAMWPSAATSILYTNLLEQHALDVAPEARSWETLRHSVSRHFVREAEKHARGTITAAAHLARAPMSSTTATGAAAQPASDDVCRAYLLGTCTRPNCKYAHPPGAAGVAKGLQERYTRAIEKARGGRGDGGRGEGARGAGGRGDGSRGRGTRGRGRGAGQDHSGSRRDQSAPSAASAQSIAPDSHAADGIEDYPYEA
jgi:branched-subunit amino acid transport protein